MTERVQKFLSSSGFCSRRKAEEFIISGQVQINGVKAELGSKVDPVKDVVKVYGKVVKPVSEKIYLILNKPKNYLVTKRDHAGRKTVYSLLPEDIRTKVWNVGRLDFRSEGLLVFTNDGELTQSLSHPSTGLEKEYEVVTTNTPTDSQLDRLRQGVELPTGMTSPAKVKTKNTKLYITIHEGKKRQIRRMLDKVGLDTLALRRVRIGNFTLPQMEPGAFLFVRKEDLEGWEI